MKEMLITLLAWIRLQIGSTLAWAAIKVAGHGIAALGTTKGPLNKMSITIRFCSAGSPFMVVTLKDKIEREFEKNHEELEEQLANYLKGMKAQMEKLNAKT